VGAIAAVLGISRGGNRRIHASPSAPRVLLSVAAAPLASAPADNSAPVVIKAVDPVPTPTPSVPTAPESSPTEASPHNNATRVTLELMPIDARVFLRGREIPGPPFSFDVPNGKKLAIEVKRPGYSTAKVVLDGKKPLVHFGMLKEGRR
jgi:hypothetical protein